MDVYESLGSGHALSQIKTVGMHTAGEPTRIIVQGFPPLDGATLLDKRAFAKSKHDNIRKRLMYEPRGHNDMYGAILVQNTELVDKGEADMGVLFCHNEGFSTMCGHATIALGRFLVDTQSIAIFPRRTHLLMNNANNRTTLILHAPCGPVHVSVPFIPVTPDHPTIKSDPSRPVSFLSVPSFATATNFLLHIPTAYRWPELSSRHTNGIRLDIGFGGAFYAVVSTQELGFAGDYSIDVALDRGLYTLTSLKEASYLLKTYLTETPKCKSFLRHPTSPELEYLYGIIVVDPPHIVKASNTPTSEVGICFFADQQIDRSPCGSGVCARVAIAIAKGERELEVPWTYHSLVTKPKDEGAFTGSVVQKVVVEHDGRHTNTTNEWDACIVKVEGYAYYTDVTTFVLEEGDNISREGFML
ncbi:proline racemase [Hysterangium stoloniferum]|nr:proline racemase [Hysterangium stoloniferum]